MDWASGWSRVCWPVFEASRHAGSARAVGCWLMEAAVQASDPVDAAPAPGEAVIEVRGLWSVFPLPGGGQHVVHQDLDLTVRRGEVLTLVGGSGTGKTVLLRQMLGLNHPARGSVTVLGRPAHELAREGAATRVGMLFQQGALFSAFSVLDNIAFPLRETGALPEALVREAALLKLRMVGLKAGDAHKMPSELSGGMIKRVALARALIMDPPLLMLDEPTRGIDVGAKQEIYRLMEELAESGVSILFVSSEMAEVLGMSDRALVMHQGRITGELSRDQLTEEAVMHLATGGRQAA